MKAKKSVHAFSILFAVLTFCDLALAQPMNTSGLQNRDAHWQWMDEKWNGDEATYQKIRTDTERNKKSGKLTSDIIEHYRLLHKKKPTDPIALYQWGYASFEATQSNPPIFQAQLISPDAFEEALSPHTYDYDRLRFLVAVHTSAHARFQSVGERLLHHTPDDDDLKYYLIQCYQPKHSEQQKQEAISLAQELIHSTPHRPGAYSALGGIYFRSWMVNHQREDGNEAVTAYREYLRIAPENYTWRRQAENIIRYIESH